MVTKNGVVLDHGTNHFLQPLSAEAEADHAKPAGPTPHAETASPHIHLVAFATGMPLGSRISDPPNSPNPAHPCDSKPYL